MASQNQQLVRVEQLRPTLRGSVVRPQRDDQEETSQILLLPSGDVQLESQPEGMVFEAPIGILFRTRGRPLMRFGPGSAGWLIGVAPGMMAEAVGQSAESALLHGLVGRTIVVRPSDQLFQETYLPLAAQIFDEVNRGRTGSQMATVALLRLLLIAFWREGERTERFTPYLGGEAELLRGFRRLVEVHFRHQLAIADYAPLLGITYDRLHSICRRGLGRTPLQLVHQRQVREAVLRLERTDEPIQSIGYSLGFAEASRFSHFFKRETGLSPAAYRQQLRQAAGTTAPQPLSHADWP